MKEFFAVATAAVSLPSGKSAGFFYINGLARMVGCAVWGGGTGTDCRRLFLNGCALFDSAAILCPAAGLHLQPQQVWLPHILPLQCLLHVHPRTQNQQNCLWLCQKGQSEWESCSCGIKDVLSSVHTWQQVFLCCALQSLLSFRPLSCFSCPFGLCRSTIYTLSGSAVLQLGIEFAVQPNK